MDSDIYKSYHGFACAIIANIVEAYKEDYLNALTSDEPEQEIAKLRIATKSPFLESLTRIILHCDVDELLTTVENNIGNSAKGKKKLTLLYSKGRKGPRV